MQVKKYFMIVVWRTQQVAAIFSMIMLALTLTLQVNLYIEWRFSNSYIGIVLTLFVLATIILVAGYAWDKKLKMWREQVQVSVERNPYTTKKMTPKEIIGYETIWIDWLEDRGRKVEADAYRKWIAHEKRDLETLKNYLELRSWLGLPEWKG